MSLRISRQLADATLLLGRLLLAWLFLQAHRCRKFADETETAVAFLGPLVCLSLLSVYHHHYDAIALFGPGGHAMKDVMVGGRFYDLSAVCTPLKVGWLPDEPFGCATTK